MLFLLEYTWCSFMDIYTTFEWRKFANRTVQTPATRSHVVCGFACGKAKSTCVIYLPDGEILGNFQMVKFWNKS